MASSKPTVTIAVCAYNEEANITAFLESVLMQQEAGFVIKKILVISDGSTDTTVKNAQAFKGNKIEVWNFKNRIGKSARLNQLYSALNTDYLVQSDADVEFSHQFVVRDMLKALSSDSKVGMCGGNPQPVQGTTFIEKAVNVTVAAYIPLRSLVRGGNNVFSADGRLLAYRASFIKNVTIPRDMIANDAFTYFCCLQNEWEYRFVKTAVVHFRSPQTLADQIRQNTRFVSAPLRMQKHFPKDLVQREFFIPKKLLLHMQLKQLVRYPLHSLYIYLVNRYCIVKSRRVESRLSARWDMAFSTKKLRARV